MSWFMINGWDFLSYFMYNWDFLMYLSISIKRDLRVKNRDHWEETRRLLREVRRDINQKKDS